MTEKQNDAPVLPNVPVTPPDAPVPPQTNPQTPKPPPNETQKAVGDDRKGD